MKTTLKSDEFYVDHPSKGEYFSLAGLQFLSELIAQAVVEAGWDPTKVSFGMANDVSVWVGYPSASTRVVTYLGVTEGKLTFEPRINKKGERNSWDEEELPLADPNLSKLLAEVLIRCLPKTSKFAKEETK